MLKRSYTAIVERGLPLKGEFATEPYEAGWATEALWFVRRLDSASQPLKDVRVQISPDGIHWIDEGTKLGAFNAAGLAFARTTHFGNWLRLAGRVAGPGEVSVLVALTLKE